MAMEIALHHPPPLPSPPLSVSVPFNLTPAAAAAAAASSPAHFLMQSREDGGGANPLPASLSLVECSGFHGPASCFLLYPQPSPQPQPFTYSSLAEGSRSRGAKLLLTSIKRCANLYFSRAATSIGASSIFSVVCAGKDVFPPNAIKSPNTRHTPSRNGEMLCEVRSAMK